MVEEDAGGVAGGGVEVEWSSGAEGRAGTTVTDGADDGRAAGANDGAVKGVVEVG